MGVGHDQVLLATARLSGPDLKVVPKRERSPVRTRHRTASGPAAYWEHGRDLSAYNPGSSPKPPYTEHRAMPVSEPTGASRHRLGWLPLAGLLLLLCLAGCTSRKSGDAATDHAIAASPSLVPTVTPVSTASPTLTLTPSPTPTLSPTPTPTLTVSGNYEDPVAHADGRYELQLAGARVATSFSTSRSPVPYGVREMPPPLFTVPEPFRPPYPVLRSAEGTPVLADGAPDPDHPEPRRFLLRVDPDGTVRYADDNHVEGVGYLAYALDTAWGTTPVANDRAVLEILDAHWFRKTLLSAVPPPEQFEVPAREMRMGDVMRTIPATRLGAFVTFDADGRVTALGAPTRAIGSDEESPGYHFHGPLLPELGQLHRLEHLDLGYRHVEAHPAGWTRRQIVAASLDRDGSILVDMGALTGAIPPQLGQLARLRYLDLQGQLLAGPLPPEMGRLASLEYLDLGSNWLAGPLPPELGQLASLEHLSLEDNQLTGPLPPEWGQLASLERLFLMNNQLTGPLPPEWGQLANLQRLDLYNNQLTGPLPPEWDQLVSLEHLYLHKNQLSGSLPPAWGQLARLKWLYLYSNQLTGSLPPAWGQLANLQRLDLENNQLMGPLPLEWTRMTSLHSLNLWHNQLTGCFPRIYFPNLTYLLTALPHCPLIDYIYHVRG